MREKRKKHLKEFNSTWQWNRKRKELSEMFCGLLLIPGSPALFYFPLTAPSNLGFSHRLSPSPPTHPQGGLFAMAGGQPKPSHQQEVSLITAFLCSFPLWHAYSVRRNPLSPPTLTRAIWLRFAPWRASSVVYLLFLAKPRRGREIPCLLWGWTTHTPHTHIYFIYYRGFVWQVRGRLGFCFVFVFPPPWS